MGTNEFLAIQLMLRFLERLPAIIMAFKKQGEDISLDEIFPRTKEELRAEADLKK